MKILVFLYEENLDDKFNEYILVGNYLQSEIELFSNKKIKIPLKKNIDNKELEKRYDFCEKSYQDILKKIAVSLNNLHNKNFSERFWEIV